MSLELHTTCDISMKTWLDEKELVIYLSSCRSKIREGRTEYNMPYHKVLGKILYNRKEIDEWVTKESKKSNIKR